MGTDKTTYESDRGGSDHCEWPEITSLEVTSPEVTWLTWPEEGMSGSMLCACASESCTIYTLVRSFDRKWRARKRRQNDVIGSVFCACPPFSRAFFSFFSPFFLNFFSIVLLSIFFVARYFKNIFLFVF
jgi:hypothetical protein